MPGMSQPNDFRDISCANCRDKAALDFDFTMAFQPIVELSKRRVRGYEALVRGLGNESAYSVIARVNAGNRYRFDQLCRVKAIRLAAELDMDTMLSINFLPNAVYRPDLCIRTALEAAATHGFPAEKIMFEFTEGERVKDNQHIKQIVEHYREIGFKTAIDDFGAGYSGLKLLADFQTDIVKVDMDLIRDIDRDRARQVILKNCLRMLEELNIECLVEGVESGDEMLCLQDLGVDLMQGYYFARPGFEALPAVDFSGL